MATLFVELWDPYADGSSMSIENNEVKVKTGKADFGTATVSISADNPLKIVTQKYGYVKDDTGKWVPGTTPEKEEVTDALTAKCFGFRKCSFYWYRRIYLWR